MTTNERALKVAKEQVYSHRLNSSSGCSCDMCLVARELLLYEATVKSLAKDYMLVEVK